MPLIKDFAASKGKAIKSSVEKQWAITPGQKPGSEQRRRPGRGIDAVLSLHRDHRRFEDGVGETEERPNKRKRWDGQTETNEDNVREPSQTETNGDKARIFETQTETNRDKKTTGFPPQTETNGDKKHGHHKATQVAVALEPPALAKPETETNGDSLKQGAQSVSVAASGHNTKRPALPLDSTAQQQQGKEGSLNTWDSAPASDNRSRSEEATETETNGDSLKQGAQSVSVAASGLNTKRPALPLDSTAQQQQGEEDSRNTWDSAPASDNRSRSEEATETETNGDSHRTTVRPRHASEHRSSSEADESPQGPLPYTSSVAHSRNATLLASSLDHSSPQGAQSSAQNPAKNSALLGQSNGDSSSVKRRQWPHQTETNEDKPSDPPLLNEDKYPSQTETSDLSQAVFTPPAGIGDHSNQPQSTGKQRQTETNAPRIDSVSVSGAPCLRFNSTLSPLENEDKRRQTLPVSVSGVPRLHLQTETLQGDKRRQLAPLPTSAQLRDILLWLARRHLETGLDHTLRLRRQDIAAGLDIPFKSVAKQISRLIAGGLIERLNVRKGRGDAGAVFYVPNAIQIASLLERDAIKRRQETSSNEDNKRRQLDEKGDVVSSLSNTTTTTEALSVEALQELVDRFRLDLDFNVGVNEVKSAYRSASLSPKAFADSIEHLAFYLRSPEAKGIKHPRAWFVKTLREGYYAEPVGFVSWEDEQMAKQVQAAQAKKARVLAMKKQLFEANYDTWFAELTPEQLGKLTRGTPFEGRARPMLRECLRSKFAEMSGQELPEDTEG